METSFTQTLEQSIKVAMLGLCLDEGVKVKGEINVKVGTNIPTFRQTINVKAWDNQCYGFYLNLEELKRYQANISVVLKEALMPFVMMLKENQLILELAGVE